MLEIIFSENLLVMLEVLGSVSMKPSDFREFMGLIKPVDGEPKVSYCKPSGLLIGLILDRLIRSLLYPSTLVGPLIQLIR